MTVTINQIGRNEIFLSCFLPKFYHPPEIVIIGWCFGRNWQRLIPSRGFFLRNWRQRSFFFIIAKKKEDLSLFVGLMAEILASVWELTFRRLTLDCPGEASPSWIPVGESVVGGIRFGRLVGCVTRLTLDLDLDQPL